MRVLLDTNVIISAILFGGPPRIIHLGVIEKRYKGVTSVVLLSELGDVLSKKFSFSRQAIAAVDALMRKHYDLVLPRETLPILSDVADNRVLEAAVSGRCEIIITGDRELLALAIFRGIRILAPREFLRVA